MRILRYRLLFLLTVLWMLVSGCSGEGEAAPVTEEALIVEAPTIESYQPEFSLLGDAERSAGTTEEAELPKIRALWVQIDAAKTPELADAMLDRAVQGKFNTILYCVGSGAVPYRSDLVDRLSFVTEAYDPLAYVIEGAHARGIQVQAWWSPGLIMKYGSLRDERPEWDIASLAEIPDDLYWANFSLPGVRRFVGDVVMEIVENYDVEGVHLDYIRYPDICAADGRLCQDFFGSDDVSIMVREIYHRLKARHPDVLLTAAVKADEGGATFLQNWPSWLAGGYIDMVMPMAYLAPARNGQLMHYLEAWGTLEGAERIVPGLSIVVDFDSEELKTPEQLGKQINLCREEGFGSVAIFDERLIDDRLLDAFARTASSP